MAPATPATAYDHRPMTHSGMRPRPPRGRPDAGAHHTTRAAPGHSQAAPGLRLARVGPGRWLVRVAPGRWLARVALAGACTAALGGCGLIGGPRTVAMDVPDEITVTSPDISQGVMSPAFGCHGSGKHPGIHWSGTPQGTKSVAVVMDDASAPITPFIYWIVFDIGPQTTDIQAGALPPGARQAGNSKGEASYDPPCPANPGHTYRFTVYALGRMLKLPAGAGVKSAWTAIASAAIARGRLTAVVGP
jgi:Raf kinase inhibitor-like YbhB/YbcL family protein